MPPSAHNEIKEQTMRSDRISQNISRALASFFEITVRSVWRLPVSPLARKIYSQVQWADISGDTPLSVSQWKQHTCANKYGGG